MRFLIILDCLKTAVLPGIFQNKLLKALDYVIGDTLHGHKGIIGSKLLRINLIDIKFVTEFFDKIFYLIT